MFFKEKTAISVDDPGYLLWVQGDSAASLWIWWLIVVDCCPLLFVPLVGRGAGSVEGCVALRKAFFGRLCSSEGCVSEGLRVLNVGSPLVAPWELQITLGNK